MSAPATKTATAIKGARCPICRAPSAEATRPFCSSRCADIDLGRWVSGGYVIPGGTADDDEDGDRLPGGGSGAAADETEP